MAHSSKPEIRVFFLERDIENSQQQTSNGLPRGFNHDSEDVQKDPFTVSQKRVLCKWGGTPKEFFFTRSSLFVGLHFHPQGRRTLPERTDHPPAKQFLADSCCLKGEMTRNQTKAKPSLAMRETYHARRHVEREAPVVKPLDSSITITSEENLGSK